MIPTRWLGRNINSTQINSTITQYQSKICSAFRPRHTCNHRFENFGTSPERPRACMTLFLSTVRCMPKAPMLAWQSRNYYKIGFECRLLLLTYECTYKEMCPWMIRYALLTWYTSVKGNPMQWRKSACDAADMASRPVGRRYVAIHEHH